MHNDAPTAPPLDLNRTVLEAIARRVCLRATYNRGEVLLAPHILHQRHGELYLDAVTLERDGRPPREIKLGTFKLLGLHDLAIVERPFTPDPSFSAKSPRYAGGTLFAV